MRKNTVGILEKNYSLIFNSEIGIVILASCLCYKTNLYTKFFPIEYKYCSIINLTKKIKKRKPI